MSISHFNKELKKMLILWLLSIEALRLLHVASRWDSHGLRGYHTSHSRPSSDHQWHISWTGREGVREGEGGRGSEGNLLIIEGGCCSPTSDALSTSAC